MDTERIALAESYWLAGELPAGGTGIMDELYNITAGADINMTSTACTEIFDGVYSWCISNMDPVPETYSIIVWQMKETGSGRTFRGKLIMGGFPDAALKAATNTDKLTFDGDDRVAANVTAMADNVIAAAKIADNAIAAAKIAAGALDNKGNWNIGKTGYALTATTGLGNQTANITGNLTGSVGSVAAGGIAAASFADNAIEAAKIANNAITADKIASNAIANAKIADGAISVGKIADNAIAAAKIASDAITGQKVADSAVTKIVGDAVALDGAAATIAGMLTKMADDNAGADFNATTDSLNKIASSTATPPTVEQIRTEMDTNSTKLAAIFDEAEEVNAKLEEGSLAPNSVRFEETT